ncbi:MAG: heparan-alpha-glucosaminide N-acetyltransferase domain-containing protein [Gemmatimonadaceae bacterium]|nr:heparan-alpha-glucosaminide N-acetyltransferase domain-containing protein [Gemmatimonadaceae bacterium]
MSSTLRPARERLASVDVFRGVTIAGMLLVNNPGLPDTVPAPLAHSPWNGCTFADLVFPAFLVVLGVTTQLAYVRGGPIAPARPIWRRAGLLFLAGVLLNAYPFFENRVTAGPAWLPVPLAHVVARFASLRVLGVLQRIGLVYLAVALMRRRCSTRALAVVTVAILAAYAVLLAVTTPTLLPPEATWPVRMDQALLNWEPLGLGWHLWDRGKPYDPEGLLSTLPAIATGLLGVLAGVELTASRALADRVQRLALGGALLIAIGLAWTYVVPLNKPLWSSSYAVFSAGTAWCGLAAAAWLTDLAPRPALTAPWLVFGTNPFVMYMGSELLANVLRSSIKWRVDGVRLSTGGTIATLLERLGAPAPLASLAWAVLFTLLCWFAVRPLYRRGRFITL